MTAEERVAALHQRMERRRRNEKRKTAALGAACAGLSLCLLLIIFSGAAHAGGTGNMYSGSTMLFENAGGYVVTALLAFAIGAAVTLICRRRAERNRNKQTNPEKAINHNQKGGERDD